MKLGLLALGLVCLIITTGRAQEGRETCPKIILKAPETIMGNGITFNISAKFEGATQPTKNFDWTVMRDSGITTITSKQWIKLETGRPEYSELIIAIAQPSDLSCKGVGVSKTLVFANVGSPLILDEYWALPWNEERARLDNAAMQMKDMPDSELIIHIAFSPSNRNASKRVYLKQVFDHLLSRKIAASQLTFAISSTKERRTTKLQPYPTKLMSGFPFSDTLVVKGEHMNTLRRLFSTKN